MTHLAALPPNRTPLLSAAFTALPLGAARPRGRLLTGGPRHSNEPMDNLAYLLYGSTNLRVAVFLLAAS